MGFISGDRAGKAAGYRPIASAVKEAAADLSADGLARVERQREHLQQVIRETTHSLARFFLEIDSNFKQFKTAARLRSHAAQRLESQGVYYKEGRVTIDRYLDAVSQYATAVATEAQYKATYNISIIALEEAKGTLLDFKQIAIVAGPNASVPSAQARPRNRAHAVRPSASSSNARHACATGPVTATDRHRPGARPSRENVQIPVHRRHRLQSNRSPRLVHHHPGPVERPVRS